MQGLLQLHTGAHLRLLPLIPLLSPSLSTLASIELDSEGDGATGDKEYVDRLKLEARGGKGGNGCVSFYQGASRGRRSTPDGGHGGDGGNMVVRAVTNMKSLAGVLQLYKGQPGLHGSKQRQHGRAGRDSVVLVPVGTVVQRLRLPEDGTEHSTASNPSAASAEAGMAEAGVEMPGWLRRWQQPYSGTPDQASDSGSSSSGSNLNSDTDTDGSSLKEEAKAGNAAAQVPAWWSEEEGEEDLSLDAATSASQHSSQQSQQGPAGAEQQQQNYEVLADLTEEGQEVVVAKGGRGGRGNAGLRPKPGRPDPAEIEQPKGLPGESARLLLELKLLADIGLVGLPSAGKSTLLRALTAASPRVGDYAFTTLSPQLGVLSEPGPADEPIVVADIPGLIEGAHQNRGLGHSFLRHIERTKAIAYVLDCRSGSKGHPGPKSWHQLATLQRELAAYSPRLARLPALVLANKLDDVQSPPRALAALRKRTTLPVLGLSAINACSVEDKQSLLLAYGALQQNRDPPWVDQLKAAGVAAGKQLVWTPDLTHLSFRLARLLHDAGGRQRSPVWAEYVAASLPGLNDGRNGSGTDVKLKQ